VSFIEFHYGLIFGLFFFLVRDDMHAFERDCHSLLELKIAKPQTFIKMILATD